MSEFSFSTIKNFDTHINNSIRGYETLIEDIIGIAEYFLEPNTKMIDIGCSTGKMICNMEETYRDIITGVEYVGIECEKNMIKNQIRNNNVIYFNKDVMLYDEWNNINLITSIFTLQFVERKHIKTLLGHIYKSLNDGGAFLFSEKVYSDYSKIQEIMTFLYYDHKHKNFTSDDIFNKEKSLRSILHSYDRTSLINIVKSVGFTKIESFWQNHNFVGYIAIK